MADDVRRTLTHSLGRLQDLQINQAEKRRTTYTQTEVDEIGAIRNLAYLIFGERGLIEINPAEPGVFYVGQYDRRYGPEVPTQNRRRMLVLRGTSHAELLAQATLLGFR